MKDKCVICGIETQYDETTHIDMRIGYVEGAGQLCRNCYALDKLVQDQTNPAPFCVPADLVPNTPNDQELGEKVRHLYYSTK